MLLMYYGFFNWNDTTFGGGAGIVGRDGGNTDRTDVENDDGAGDGGGEGRGVPGGALNKVQKV